MALPIHPSHRRALAPALAFALGAALATTAAAAPLKVPYQTFTLDNGLKVILHEDHSLPILSVNTWYHVGSGDEKPGRTGFAHLFEHIMFMGSQHVPTGDFDKLLEATGASNNGSTTEDRTNYYEDGPSNALPLMLWLDSDRMGYLLPEITADKVDLQRGVVQNERRQSYENQPYGLSEENILKRLYPDNHPYHWPVIGSMADLSAASIEDVREFFRKYYAPNNATLCIGGDIQPADARKLVERWFGDIPRGPELTRPVVPAFTLPSDVYGTLEDRVQVPRVYDAWHSTKTWAPDDAAIQVMTEVLAGGKTSRLYKRLVYELQIANQVVAYQDAGRLDGKIVLFATARAGHDLNELQNVINEEVKKLAASGPTTRELERVKNSIEAEFIGAMEQVGGFGGKTNQLNQYDYFVGEPDSFERDLDRYRAVTAADVQRVANQYLAQSKRVVLSVVPQGQTKLAVTEGVKP
jgi:zinc protease